ncbi:hypothetical protein SLEP1_g16193 [Rubroshorea leprosula]|uniref:Uncharacterized protein n=1 Tax=Rubroshorea leprosula TaxID=152421 RepID=A0AAV5IQ45_9ROSI|nr:hypothetical protein SLEP1_g16193 [Rubroshorea leprosula]
MMTLVANSVGTAPKKQGLATDIPYKWLSSSAWDNLARRKKKIHAKSKSFRIHSGIHTQLMTGRQGLKFNGSGTKGTEIP